MVRSRVGALFLIAAGLSTLVWASRPPDDIVFNRSCQIVGLRDRLSAALYGDTFWQGQLDALRAERDRQARLPAEEARAVPATEMGGIERRMNHLAARDAPAERQEGRPTDQRRRLETIGWLNGCEPLLAARLPRR